MNTEEMWDTLLEIGVEKQTLRVVSSINGYSEETMENVLYVITGYRSFQQWLSEDED